MLIRATLQGPLRCLGDEDWNDFLYCVGVHAERLGCSLQAASLSARGYRVLFTAPSADHARRFRAGLAEDVAGCFSAREGEPGRWRVVGEQVRAVRGLDDLARAQAEVSALAAEPCPGCQATGAHAA